MRTLPTFFLFLLAQSIVGQTNSRFVGDAACEKCHAAVQHSESSSLHSKIFQAANHETVQGNFAAGRLDLRGSAYVVQYRNGKYYITESELNGKLWEHVVDYTLGARRVQHYLTTLPDGRIVVLPPTWDIVRKEWVHNLDVENPEETA
ncbi:MAG: hypothetical protein JO065_12335, partial [Acidobacteria bacterium]|nr:hypothetical protein [Acidobacteriota bacterium]